MKKREKLSKFGKFLRVYVIILTVLMIIFLIYVANSLIENEKNQLENYIPNVVSNLDKYTDLKDIKKSEFEESDANVKDLLDNIVKDRKVTYKTTSKGQNVYDVYADDDMIMELTLNGDDVDNRLGLLAFSKWKVEKVEPNTENLLYTANISVPNNYKVYVNAKVLTDEQIKDGEQDGGLAQISKYVDIPYLVEYEVSNLIKAPKVKILNENGAEVEYKTEGNKITKDLEFKTIENKEEALKEIKGNVDVKKIAEEWSLYLSDDLSGNLHGFYNISKYLIKDSTMYQNARQWATGVDITFVSSHTLSNPTFTNEEIKNFEIYNENAFSCEIHLVKNLILKSGKKIEDVMHERLFFAYYDEPNDGKVNPEWKLVNMQSIVD